MGNARDAIGCVHFNLPSIALTVLPGDTVSDYKENPLLMDYYGFQPSLYQLKFKSRGDSVLAQRVVDLYKEVRLCYSP